MGKYFGTDGIRGLANVDPVTPERALQIGRALGHAVRQQGERPRVVIGRDTRLSGPMLEDALSAGLCSVGAEPERAGVLPTPAIAWLTRQRKAAAGVVISASHNPFEDNGIKFFGPDGFKLDDAREGAIERAMDGGVLERSTAEQIGRPLTVADGLADYVEALASSTPDGFSLAGMRIVIDCSNGAASEAGPLLLSSLGAEVTVLGASPTGVNINLECGALHPRILQHRVLETGAALGIAVDGDADRLVVVDERGQIADGDDVLGMIALDRHQDARALPVVVGTVMSNLGLELTLRRIGAELVRAAVGDRFVVEAMRQRGSLIGGEPSGHLIFLEHATTGDGLLAALQVAEMMVRRGRSLSELRSGVERCPQALVNVRVSRRQDLKALPAVVDAIRSVEAALHDRGRVLVRYSGTEPLVRVMVEGEDETEVRRHAAQLAEVIRVSAGAAQE